VQARRENLILKQVDGTLVPRVGVLLLDSPRRDSQSDGKQLTADWPCRVALPGCWIELIFGDNWYSARKNTNQCKDARALKEPEGCRVDAP